jgi:hypothetical protein
MSKYLTRLNAIIQEKHPPARVPKVPKALSVTFGTGEGRRVCRIDGAPEPDEAEPEERKGMASARPHGVKLSMTLGGSCVYGQASPSISAGLLVIYLTCRAMARPGSADSRKRQYGTRGNGRRRARRTGFREAKAIHLF